MQNTFYGRCLRFISLVAVLLGGVVALQAADRPNVIVIYADDISARELPLYGSSVWSPPEGGNSSDASYRASTPVLDRLATSADGVWFTQAWAATVCSPSRAMMMTGRYASLHKWWHNGAIGSRYEDPTQRLPFYESSDFLIAHVAGLAGYASMWTGKTQMKGPDMFQFGFDEGVWTPGESQNTPGSGDTATGFRVEKVDGVEINMDTGLAVDTYAQTSWYWKPSVVLMNHPSAPGVETVWEENPNDVTTYGPDVELDFIFDFMERKHASGQPFFVYHTTHLGHDAFDWLHPDSTSKWPGTPKIEWHADTETYTRTEPNVTGDNGIYDTHGTVTDPGIHHHINYLDYQIWLYLQKLEELGIEEDTILIFCADNGTSGYGKASKDRQKGAHVPLIVYAPGAGFTKTGEQSQLASMADILPTLRDIMGVRLPASYELHGESLWPYLTTSQAKHRDWNYAYREDAQLVRGALVMMDANEKWWDVSGVEPADLISYPEITDWEQVSQAHRDERDALLAAIAPFDLFDAEFDEPAPVVPAGPEGATLTVPVLQDADVKSGAPDSNFNASFMKIAGSQPRYGYVQFDLSEVADPMASVTLWVRNYSGTSMDGTLSVFAADNGWDETTVTWNTKPAGDPAVILNSVDMTAASEWYAMDLSSHVATAGIYTLGLNSEVSDPLGLIYAKEGGSAAYLEIELDQVNPDYDPLVYWMYQNAVKYPDWDDDGDGVLNEEEFVVGTDPNDRASVYMITAEQSEGGDFHLSFDTLLDRSYTVQWKETLADQVWVDLAGAIDLSGTGEPIGVVDSFGASERFYRVVVELE